MNITARKTLDKILESEYVRNIRFSGVELERASKVVYSVADSYDRTTQNVLGRTIPSPIIARSPAELPSNYQDILYFANSVVQLCARQEALSWAFGYAVAALLEIDLERAIDLITDTCRQIEQEVHQAKIKQALDNCAQEMGEKS